MATKKPDFIIIAPTPFFQNRGCHMRIRGEAEALQKKGCPLVIITYPQGEDVEDIEIVRSPVQFGDFGKGVSATWKNLPAGFVLFWIVLREAIYRRPKIIYGHLFEGAAIGIAVKYLSILLSLFRYNPLLVLDAQDSLSEKMVSYGMVGKNSLLYFTFHWLEKIILFFPDHVFTSSIRATSALKGVNPHVRPVTLPDGFSIFQKGVSKEYVENFKKTDGKNKALAIMSSSLLASQYAMIKEWIKNKNPIIVYGGSFSEAKGFPEFFKQCLPELLKNEDVRFLLGGGKPTEIADYNEIIKGKSDRVVLLSDLNSKNLLYFLLLGDVAIDCKPPQTTESSGKILNYIAAGLPVACFDQENNRYFLEKGGAYSKSYVEFTENIVNLAKNPSSRKKIEKNNLDRAWNKFTWDKSAEKILKIIDK